MNQPSSNPKSSGKRPLVDVLADSLDTNRDDLTQLLIPINRKKAPKKLIQNLLRQSCQRLEALRSKVDELVNDSAEFEDVLPRVQSVHQALAADTPLSLDNAAVQIQAAIELLSSPVPLLAALHHTKALIAQLQQDHQHAAEAIDCAINETPADAPTWPLFLEKARIFEDLGRDFGVNHGLGRAQSILEDEVLPNIDQHSHREDWASAMHTLGNVLGMLGQRQGGSRSLQRAIEVFEASLARRDKSASPIDWAQTHNALGTVLGILGQRQSEDALLTRATESFRDALTLRQQETYPHEWATTTHNLAAVLQAIGQRKQDSKILKESVEAYRSVLSHWTREHYPIDWALTMNNLGTALRLLGEHRKGPRTLEQSVAAYRSALTERSKEQFPDDWAMTQNNLGASLQKLAQREENIDTLMEAIHAYESAIEVWTKDRAPMSWTMTMGNLAVARRTLAEVTSDLQTAKLAVEELEAVNESFREASHAQYSELGIDQLAQARKLVETLKNTPEPYPHETPPINFVENPS